MHTFSDGLLEMELRKRGIEAEIERARWARLAAEGRSQTKREGGIRRLAIRVGDALAGLQCRLRSRFAADASAVAC